MIGTAFYVLGVIACMILIVLAVLAAIGFVIAFSEQIMGVLGLLALLAFVWWIATKISSQHIQYIVVALGVITAVTGFSLWFARDPKKRNRELNAHNQRQR